MREILFRGKRINDGAWIFGAYLTADSRHYICNEDVFDDVDPETVGEFTGLVDKNGVKVFEGDLIRRPTGDKPEHIAYLCGIFRKLPADFSDDFGTFDEQDSAMTEVVGNIHENSHSFDWESGRAEVIGNEHDNSELLEGRAEL